MTILDRRLTPARSDLAAAFLEGRVEAARFVSGVERTVTVPVAPVRRAPRTDAPLDTEALRGERVTAFDEAEGWAWVQLGRDRYVGYLPSDALGAVEAADARVNVMRTFVYPGPDMKLPVTAALPFGAALRVMDRDGAFARIAEGFVWSAHLHPIEAVAPDFVAVAERFTGLPYLWGGRSSFGLDCSGLVQTALMAAGLGAPRDSDMQAAALGEPLATDTAPRRGDLVFWPGHVGLMRDATELLHATAHTMLVTSEPLAEARARIRAKTGFDVTVIRRLG